MRPPPSFTRASKSSPNSLLVVLAGRVRLYTMNGADWSKRYPRIVEAASRIKVSAVMDAEVVCLYDKGLANFEHLA